MKSLQKPIRCSGCRKLMGWMDFHLEQDIFMVDMIFCKPCEGRFRRDKVPQEPRVENIDMINEKLDRMNAEKSEKDFAELLKATFDAKKEGNI